MINAPIAATMETYPEWVRRMVGIARHSSGKVVTLFDSSPPEPVALLGNLVREAFTDPMTDRYVSAFQGGNPFIIEHLARLYDMPRESILGTTGATGALSLLYRSLVTPGDHVLVETPGFDFFRGLAEQWGATVDTVERRTDRFILDPDEVIARVGPKTRLIILSNLHNPSGMPIAHAHLVELGRLAENHNLRIIVDEVYGGYADKICRPFAAAQISPVFISISSLTKIFGLSTLRCGWIAGAPDVMERVRNVSYRSEISLSNLSHAAAALVFAQEDRFFAYSHEMIAQGRPIMAAAMDRWRADGLAEGIMPDFGCIFFPRLIGIEDTLAFTTWLAKRSGVVVAPGEHFQMPGHIRLGFARDPSELAWGLDVLSDALPLYRETRYAAL